MSSENLRERVLDLLKSTNKELSNMDVAQSLDERPARVYNMLMTLALEQLVTFDPKTRLFKFKTS
jgi:DNA-binding IclR family transcriptional regulator